MIGLSLLPTAHPSPFQRKLVRASMECYLHFTLAMGRSLGFASAHTDYIALFRLALAPAPYLKYLTSPTVSGSISLPCSGCFPPFPHGTGPLSVFRECLAFRDGPRYFRQDSTCPALLRWQTCPQSLTLTGVSPSAPCLSRHFWFALLLLCLLL